MPKYNPDDATTAWNHRANLISKILFALVIYSQYFHYYHSFFCIEIKLMNNWKNVSCQSWKRLRTSKGAACTFVSIVLPTIFLLISIQFTSSSVLFLLLFSFFGGQRAKINERPDVVARMHYFTLFRLHQSKGKRNYCECYWTK